MKLADLRLEIHVQTVGCLVDAGQSCIDQEKLATTPGKDPPIGIEQLEETLSKVRLCCLVTASAS